MAAGCLQDVGWYGDRHAVAEGQPGIYNSFVASLGAALNCKGERIPPVELMGATGWAFRILAHRDLCPSAMSVFDWTTVLTESVEQMGRRCTYVSRYWHEQELEEKRRRLAHQAIVDAIQAGTPAIVWDIHIPEWGLITGYDDEAEVYLTLGCDRQRATMPYGELGQREIKILSVTVIGEPNGRTSAERQRRALELAVAHARHREWLDRDAYQNGPEAFETWAAAIERPAEAAVNWDFANYYAGHYYGARLYAAEYLTARAAFSGDLRRAADAYRRVAEHLRPVWKHFRENDHPSAMPERRAELAASIRVAGRWEIEAIEHIENHLAATQRELGASS